VEKSSRKSFLSTGLHATQRLIHGFLLLNPKLILLYYPISLGHVIVEMEIGVTKECCTTLSDSAIPYQCLTSLMYAYPITQVQSNSTHAKMSWKLCSATSQKNSH